MHSNCIEEVCFFDARKKLIFPNFLHFECTLPIVTTENHIFFSKHKIGHMFSFFFPQMNRDAPTLVRPMSLEMFGNQSHAKYVSVTPDPSSAMTSSVMMHHSTAPT